MSLSSFKDFLKLEKKYSDHTLLAYSNDIESFFSFLKSEFKQLENEKVNYSQVRYWITKLVDMGLSNGTINRKVSSLKTYYKYLVKIEVLKSSPLLNHKALKQNKKIQIPFSEDEIKAVLELNINNHFDDIRNKLIVELLYSTGIRRAELINLKLTDVDINQNQIKVLGKRNKERYIPLMKSVQDTISLYLIKRNLLDSIDDKPYLFLTKKGKKIYSALVYRVVKNYFNQASTKVKKSPHILRHSFATTCLTMGQISIQ